MGKWLDMLRQNAFDTPIHEEPTEQQALNPTLTTDLENEQERFLERAAIMEYDGGLTRQEAETRAKVIEFKPRLTRDVGTTVGGVRIVRMIGYSKEHAKQDGMLYCSDCARGCKLEEHLQPHRCSKFKKT